MTRSRRRCWTAWPESWREVACSRGGDIAYIKLIRLTGGSAALMRINIWIVLAVLLALWAATRLWQDQRETQRICGDDPSASM
jgi:hypothetical protein